MLVAVPGSHGIPKEAACWIPTDPVRMPPKLTNLHTFCVRNCTSKTIHPGKLNSKL